MTRPIVLCFGGRNFADVHMIDHALDTLLRERFLQGFSVLHGDARGADRNCGAWGMTKGFPVIAVAANWDRYGKAAGSLRNGWMLELNPVMAVGFPGGTGTADMAGRCIKAGVPMWAPFGLDQRDN